MHLQMIDKLLAVMQDAQQQLAWHAPSAKLGASLVDKPHNSALVVHKANKVPALASACDFVASLTQRVREESQARRQLATQLQVKSAHPSALTCASATNQYPHCVLCSLLFAGGNRECASTVPHSTCSWWGCCKHHSSRPYVTASHERRQGTAHVRVRPCAGSTVDTAGRV